MNKNVFPFCLEIDKSCNVVYYTKNAAHYPFPNVLFSPALKCPTGSHYNSCSTACPQPSCQDPTGPGGSCNQPCVEGCFCNPGLVLSGDKCVPLSECGCTDGDGKYRPVSVLSGSLKGDIFLALLQEIMFEHALNVSVCR